MSRIKQLGSSWWAVLVVLLVALRLDAGAQTPVAPAPRAAVAVAALNAAVPLALRDTAQEYNLGRSWDVLPIPKDSINGLTFRQLSSPDWASRFRRSTQAVPSYLGWKGEVWLRRPVVNQANAHTSWLLRAKLEPYEEFTAYVVTADGQVQQLVTDATMPFARTHAVTNGKYNIALALPLGQPVTLYVRTTGGVLNFSICEQRNLQEISYWETIGLAMFLGAMLMLAFYNAFLFVSIREIGYFYYAAYVLASCVLNLQIKGLLYQWFFPHQSAFAQHQQQLFLIGLVTLLGALMARSFLETRRLVPRLDRLLPLVMLSTPLPVLLNWVLQDTAYVAIDLYYPMVTSLVWLVIGIAVLRTGYQPARYYMAGWGLLILSIMVFSLVNLNILPVNGWTMNFSAVAWVMEMVFLSFGLASRFNLARQARQEAQNLAMARLHEKEQVQESANRQLATRATELKQAYDELRDSQATSEQLKTMDELKTNFFTNISHEFRTPLTLILGPAESLVTEFDDQATRQYGNLILRNAKRLLRLINQLLDLSKLDAGAMQLTPSRADVALLARQQAATFASLAEARGIRFRTEGPANLSFVVDTPKLETILTNLLSNALRFTPTGGEVVLRWQEIAQGPGPAVIELAVSDTGPGIAAAHLAHLFERFYQGAQSGTAGAHPGTGVGLTLVKELTELHGGTVAVSSPTGEGATFTVRIPAGLLPLANSPENQSSGAPKQDIAAILEDTARPDASQAEDPDEVDPTADLILFIEDNADVREYIRSSLLPAGYRLLEASDGLTGVALASEYVPDLVISDVMMPGLDGYEVVRRLKHEVATSHIPVVLLTAKSADTDRLAGLETGADAYLGKPFSARELRAQVRNLLALGERNRAFSPTAKSLPLVEKPPQSFDGPEEVSAPAVVAAQFSAIDQAFLKKIAATVEANLEESEFGVDELSREAALSRTQLQRKLRALTGQAPAEYIRQARLQRALVLLRAGAGSISEIGYQVGFSSPAHFSTVFSRHFGFPPSEVTHA